MMKRHIINAVRNFMISFAILVMGHLVFSIMGMWNELNNERVLYLLLICLAVNILQLLTSLISIESIYLELLIRFVEMYVVVFFLGGKVFRIFQYSLKDVLSVGFLLIVIYFGICFYSFYSNMKEVQRINEIIKNRKKKQ